MGTLDYMSPEQARGQELDHRTDIFSLGVVLYRMVSGELPFHGPHAASILEKILYAPTPSLRTVCPQAPEELEQTIARATAKDPRARFKDMNEMASALRSVSRDAEEAETAENNGISGKKKFRISWRWPVIAGVLILLTLLTLPFRGHFQPSMKRPVLPSKVRRGGAFLCRLLGSLMAEALRSSIRPGGDSGAGIIQVAQFQKNLSVISSTDIRSEKISSVSQARRIFGINLALAGSIQKYGDVLRILFYFVDADSLQQICAERYEASAFEILGMDEDIFNKAVALLDMKLSPEVQHLLSAGKTSVSDAYASYLKAQGYLSRYYVRENLDKAIELLKKAIREDPQCAQAYAALGEAYYWKFRGSNQRSWADAALSSCKQAQQHHRSVGARARHP